MSTDARKARAEKTPSHSLKVSVSNQLLPRENLDWARALITNGSAVGFTVMCDKLIGEFARIHLDETLADKEAAYKHAYEKCVNSRYGVGVEYYENLLAQFKRIVCA